MNPERMPLIAGNWKENPRTLDEAVKLAAEIIGLTSDLTGDKAEILITPPDVYLSSIKNIKLCAQNLSQFDEGAHTGEISGEMLRSVGVEYVIVGHSERRSGGETNEIVREKIKAALRHGLLPILCVGETLKEKEDGKAKEVITEQLTKALDGLTAEDMAKVVIAYEPVWAIGTGKNATPEDAEGMCSHIRSEIARLFTQAVADKIRILYGGSVKPENIGSYMAQPDVDGALVGGAALKAEDFANIVNFEVEEE